MIETEDPSGTGEGMNFKLKDAVYVLGSAAPKYIAYRAYFDNEEDEKADNYFPYKEEIKEIAGKQNIEDCTIILKKREGEQPRRDFLVCTDPPAGGQKLRDTFNSNYDDVMSGAPDEDLPILPSGYQTDVKFFDKPLAEFLDKKILILETTFSLWKDASDISNLKTGTGFTLIEKCSIKESPDMPELHGTKVPPGICCIKFNIKWKEGLITPTLICSSKKVKNSCKVQIRIIKKKLGMSCEKAVMEIQVAKKAAAERMLKKAEANGDAEAAALAAKMKAEAEAAAAAERRRLEQEAAAKAAREAAEKAARERAAANAAQGEVTPQGTEDAEEKEKTEKDLEKATESDAPAEEESGDSDAIKAEESKKKDEEKKEKEDELNKEKENLKPSEDSVFGSDKDSKGDSSKDGKKGEGEDDLESLGKRKEGGDRSASGSKDGDKGKEGTDGKGNLEKGKGQGNGKGGADGKDGKGSSGDEDDDSKERDGDGSDADGSGAGVDGAGSGADGDKDKDKDGKDGKEGKDGKVDGKDGKVDGKAVDPKSLVGGPDPFAPKEEEGASDDSSKGKDSESEEGEDESEKEAAKEGVLFEGDGIVAKKNDDGTITAVDMLSGSKETMSEKDFDKMKESGELKDLSKQMAKGTKGKNDSDSDADKDSGNATNASNATNNTLAALPPVPVPPVKFPDFAKKAKEEADKMLSNLMSDMAKSMALASANALDSLKEKALSDIMSKLGPLITAATDPSKKKGSKYGMKEEDLNKAIGEAENIVGGIANSKDAQAMLASEAMQKQMNQLQDELGDAFKNAFGAGGPGGLGGLGGNGKGGPWGSGGPGGFGKNGRGGPGSNGANGNGRGGPGGRGANGRDGEGADGRGKGDQIDPRLAAEMEKLKQILDHKVRRKLCFLNNFRQIRFPVFQWTFR